jgi:hypothetical protein
LGVERVRVLARMLGERREERYRIGRQRQRVGRRHYMRAGEEERHSGEVAPRAVSDDIMPRKTGALP